MCSTQNRRFKSKRVQHDYRNKWIKNIYQTYQVNVNANLMEQNVIQTNGGITINVDVSMKIIIYVKKIVSNSATCNCENWKYLASIMYDSAIICDEIIKSYHKEIKTIPTNFNKKISLVKHKVSIFYLPFY